MSTLEKTLQTRAIEFANAIVAALKGASIDELVSMEGKSRTTSSGRPAPVARRKGGRLVRRSLEDITTTLGSIVSLVNKHPKGLRAEQIRTELGLDTRELPRPLAEGLKTGALKKTGQKRATTYFVGGAKKRAGSKQ